MRMNRRPKYLKQTETLHSFASRQKRDTAICETDIPLDPNNTIVPQHKLREFHIVLQRLRVLPDRVKVQDHEVGLSNRQTKITLEVSRLGVHDPKLPAGASHKLSKQINTTDITSINPPLFPKNSSLTQTSDLKYNSNFDGSQLTETSVNSFKSPGSPDSDHKKSISITEKNENVFSVDESPNKGNNVNTISSITTSKNESQEQTEYSPNCSKEKEMLLQNKSNPKKTRKSLEHANALYNKELRNLLADKLGEKYDLIFTASDINLPTSEPTPRITRSSIHSVTDKTVKREIYILKEEKVNSNEAEKFTDNNSENQGPTSIKIPQIFSQSISSNKTSLGTKRKRYIQNKHVFPEAEKESTQIKNCSNESKDGQSFKNEELYAESPLNNLHASPFSTSKNLSEEDNKISTKNVANNKIVIDTTEQKNGKEEGSPSFNMHGCALTTTEANFSLNNDQGKSFECDAKIGESIHLKEDDKFKQVALRIENEKSCNGSDSSPPLQLLNLQNEKQVQSSKGVDQESHKSESGSNPSEKESATRPQTNFSSRADSEKEKSSRKFEFIAKSDATPFQESESDLFNRGDNSLSGITREHSTNNEYTYAMSDNKFVEQTVSNVSKKITSNNDEKNGEISLTSKKIDYLRKRKMSTDLPTISNQNISSLKSVNDSSIGIINTPLGKKSANSKGKTKKIVTDTSSSRTKQTLATRRRVATSIDSNIINNINSSLEETSIKNQELPKNSDSTIDNEKNGEISLTPKKIDYLRKRKMSTDLPTITNQNISSLKSVNDSSNDIINTPLGKKSANSKGKTKKIVTDTSSSRTKQTLATRRRVATSIDSNSSNNINSSLEETSSKNQELPKNSDSTIANEKKKIVTDTAPSAIKQTLSSTLSTCNDCNIKNSSLEEIQSKQNLDLSNELEFAVVKGKKKKVATDLSTSMTSHTSRRRITYTFNSSSDINVNSSVEEIASKDQEHSKDCDSLRAKEKKKKIIIVTSPSITRQKHVFTTSDFFNSSNTNSTAGEVPNKYQELSNDSKSSIIKGIKKKIVTNPLASITRQKLASRRRVFSSSISSNAFNINSSLQETQSKGRKYSMDSQSAFVKGKKRKFVTDKSLSTTQPNLASSSSDSHNDVNINSLFEGLPVKDKTLSNDSKSPIPKRIKKKFYTNMSVTKRRRKLASRRQVSNLTNSSNDLTINSSSEEIQPKVQELLEGSIPTTVKGKKRKIVTTTSSSSTSMQNLASEKQLLSESSDDNINNLLIKNQSENLESLKESDSSSLKLGEEGTNSKDSSKNVTNNLVFKTETSALHNKKSVTNKKNNAKRKCSYKKERKKIKTIGSLEIASQADDKFSDKVECAKTSKHPEIQLKKQLFTDSSKSNIDTPLPENSRDSSPGHSADANTTSKNIESDSQNSVEIIGKISSEEYVTLKEDNTSINVHQTVEKNETGIFSNDISISSSSNNSLSAVDSILIPSSDYKSKHPISIEHSLKASPPELEVSQKQKSDPQISSNDKLDLSNENIADHSTKSTDKLNKELSTFSLKETINERKESSNEEPNETRRRLESFNKQEDSATSLTVATMSKSLPIKEMQDKLSQIVAQVESESSNLEPAEAAEKSFKIDLSLSVSNALKSTKLALMPSHKALMANYLLKQLAFDQSPSKHNNEINLPTNLNKLEKVQSEPPLCLTCDFSTENNAFKKGNEDLSNKPENVQKVTSSTSIKENDGEHTFKIPNKAAPKAKKKSVYTKSNTFLKPKTNDNNIFLQRMMSNLRGKTKYTKLFIPGTIQRRIMTSHLMKVPPNRNEKKIPVPCNGNAGHTMIQNPTLSKNFLKNMSEFKQASSNKTIETVHDSALQLKNVSLVPNANKSQIYIPKDEERAGTERNFSLPETHSLYLRRSIKKQNIINHCKQDNEVILKPNEQECNVPCQNGKILHSDKEVTRRELNKYESQSPTRLTSAKCAIHGNNKPLESNSSSEIVSSLITHNKSEDKIYKNTFQVECEPSSYINKDKVSLTKQISDGTNFKKSSPSKPMGSSCKSVESNVLEDNVKKTENMVEKKGNNQKNFDSKNNTSKDSSFNVPQTSESWNQLKQCREPQVSDKVFCLNNLSPNRLDRSETSSENTTHTQSDDCSPQNENVILKETNKNVNSSSNESKIRQNQSPQTNDSEQRFQNKVSNQTTLNEKYTSNLKSVSDSKDNNPKNMNSSEINVPLKQQSQKFVLISNNNNIAQTQNKTIFRNSSEREKLVTSESSDLPQDTSSKTSNLAAQVCDLISELRNLDNTTTVALNNYKKSINNEEVNQELKAMVLREGLSLKSHPDRPPEWFLKFIANFRKQELWRLHQMFKIHDHLMRIESAKLNVLEKVYEELKENEGIKND